ncbi:MAG: site-specific integrase, partial [Coriobacteriaceae bacterium]|nr:site-specific integrase [Coriobacteriaceae bacterium]
MDGLVREYLAYLSVERGSSPKTIEAYARDLRGYQEFLDKQGISDIDAITRDDVIAYEASLVAHGYAPSTIERHISVLKGFHRFLVRETHTTKNP